MYSESKCCGGGTGKAPCMAAIPSAAPSSTSRDAWVALQRPVFVAVLGSFSQQDLVVSGETPMGDNAAIGGAIATFNRNGYGTNLNLDEEKLQQGRDGGPGQRGMESDLQFLPASVQGITTRTIPTRSAVTA